MSKVIIPNESLAYRSAREELLNAEIGLREQVEKVASLRRALPMGGALREDYVFEELIQGRSVNTAFSSLFRTESDTLFVYNFMYGPSMDAACAMCVSLLDGLDGQIPHLNKTISTAIVAQHDAKTLNEFAQSRGWKNLRMISSGNNTFNQDYLAERDGGQLPMAHVFQRKGPDIRHFWSSEMFYGDWIEGGHARHVDSIWPLWNVLDLTPNGRGAFFPSL